MFDKNFRLSPSIRPARYRFFISPDLAAGTFTGRGSIEMTLDERAPAVVLHGAQLEIDSASIRAGDGAFLDAAVTSHTESQTLTFNAGRELPAGSATLFVRWRGTFQNDLRGLYLAGGIGVTQFEAADARRVFPCFDEPAFKAIWKLSVEAPEGAAVIGNGAVLRDEIVDGKRVVDLAPTPPLSSYLVAVVIGRLVPSAEVRVRGVPLRTYSVPDKAHLTAFAQDCASSVLPLLEDYFDRPYVFGKVDQVGIPDFEAGAMENAGCITFREIALLVDPARAPLNMQKRVAEVVTHELAHMWFGNLVTMQWWDDLWLNEAFATWMAYKVVDQWRPGWRMWDDFEQGKADALHLDSMESTHPIRTTVRNADEATENFDVITYEKGGAMLRMIEGYLGAEPFRAGIRGYMRAHAWGNAVADDLWSALARASGQPIEAVANGWIGRGGFPLVTLERDGAKVSLSQRRFHADPDKLAAADAEPPWLIPVVLRFRDDEGVKEARLLLGERTGAVTLDAKGPVRFACGNKDGTGFYRVRYDAAEISALRAHAADLSPVERMNLVADSWALFRAGAAPLAPLLDLLLTLAADDDYVVLGEVVSRLDALERRFAEGGDRFKLRRVVEEAFADKAAAFGWDASPGESDARRLARAQSARALASVARAPAAVDALRSRLRRSLDGDGAALDANLLDTATVATARAAGAAFFDELLSRKEKDPDPAAKRRYLVGLGSVEDEALRERAIGLLLDDAVPMQDITTYTAALLGNPALRDRAFDHIRAEWPRVHDKSKAPMLTRRMVESLGGLTHRRAEVEAFFDEHAASFAAAPQAVKQTRERLRLDEDVLRRARAELSAWLAASEGRSD